MREVVSSFEKTKAFGCSVTSRKSDRSIFLNGTGPLNEIIWPITLSELKHIYVQKHKYDPVHML